MTKEEFLEATESAPIVLAVFVKDGESHPLINAVATRAAESTSSIRIIQFDLDALGELVEEYKQNMNPLSGTLNFESPGLALYREGELVTTFNPWMNSGTDKLNEGGVERQLDIFLGKLATRQSASGEED